MRIPLAVPASSPSPGNHDELTGVLDGLVARLRSRWWREHLVIVAPAADLAAAMPGLRLDDPGLADAVASAWVSAIKKFPTEVGRAIT